MSVTVICVNVTFYCVLLVLLFLKMALRKLNLVSSFNTFRVGNTLIILGFSMVLNQASFDKIRLLLYILPVSEGLPSLHAVKH